MLATMLAQNGDSNAANPAGTLVPFVLIIALFYFLFIRPQRRNMRAQQELLRSLEVGDEVETIAGMFGRITRMDEDTVWVDVAPGTTVRMARRAIRRKVVEEAP